MDLVRKQTYITPAQDRAVKRLAQQQGTTEAEILRKALDLLIALIQSRPDIDAVFAFGHHLALAGIPVLPGPLNRSR